MLRTTLAAASLLASLAAFGQTAPPQDVIFMTKPMDHCAAFHAMAHGAGAPGTEADKPALAPYSGVGTTRMVRTLADGNRIVQTNVMRYARDSQGRTRTEYSLAALGPFSLEETHTMVTIEDPVAKKRYVLHPEQKVAHVFDTSTMPGPFVKHEFRGATASGGVSVASSGTTSAVAVGTLPAPPQAGAVSAMPAVPMHGARMFMATRGAPIPFAPGCAPEQANGRKMPAPVSLGERYIEGVKVIGSRHEYEIAAGAVGNEQPIRVRSEQWFSPELGVVVESTHMDPLVGETTYELSEIRRGDPDAALFAVPAGYETREIPAPKFESFELKAPPPQP